MQALDGTLHKVVGWLGKVPGSGGAVNSIEGQTWRL
jgi:hypothetical protein